MHVLRTTEVKDRMPVTLAILGITLVPEHVLSRPRSCLVQWTVASSHNHRDKVRRVNNENSTLPPL